MRVDLRKKILIAVALTLCSGCSHQLSRSKAEELITAEPEWSKPVTASAHVGGISSAFVAVDFEKKLESLGYLKVRGPFFSLASYLYVVELTQKGRDTVEKRGWKMAPSGERDFLGRPAQQPTPMSLTIPIGRLRFAGVTGILGDQNQAKVEYLTAVDCNEDGKEVGCDGNPKAQSATFTRYDDGWRLDRKK